MEREQFGKALELLKESVGIQIAKPGEEVEIFDELSSVRFGLLSTLEHLDK